MTKFEQTLYDKLSEEYLQYGDFLQDMNINTLLTGARLNGKLLDYKDVRKMYDEWCKNKKL